MKTDSAYIQEVISSPSNQYLEEIPGMSAVDLDPAMKGIQKPMSDEALQAISWIVLTIVLAAGVMMLIRHIERLKDGKAYVEAPGSMGSDTIYDHEWDEEIAERMASGDFGEAVVLAYLHWLEHLNAEGAIVFHQSKTPGMFVTETVDAAGKDIVTADDLQKTRTLTHHYLRVRYGHKKVSAEQARQIIGL